MPCSASRPIPPRRRCTKGKCASSCRSIWTTRASRRQSLCWSLFLRNRSSPSPLILGSVTVMQAMRCSVQARILRLSLQHLMIHWMPSSASRLSWACSLAAGAVCERMLMPPQGGQRLRLVKAVSLSPCVSLYWHELNIYSVSEPRLQQTRSNTFVVRKRPLLIMPASTPTGTLRAALTTARIR
ncbi:hypothetical protein LY76DRAFT_60799 [Colletotrichum caudatum]|nr:hypothetical protein LY76DRAFT_60799 [Colletotrichum caudatum]